MRPTSVIVLIYIIERLQYLEQHKCRGVFLIPTLSFVNDMIFRKRFKESYINKAFLSFSKAREN